MPTNKHGIAPGQDTPENDGGLPAPNNHPTKIFNKYRVNLWALCRSLRATHSRVVPWVGAALGLVVAHMMAGGVQ